MPPYADDFENEDDIFNKLTVLVAKHPTIKTWVFKINNEVGGRGIAYIPLD